jgi:branched-chain amino acid transport system ATP-binding protein
LRIDDLVKRFAGVAATDRLSLSVFERELHAVIGPNGAGKSTLLAQISGELKPDSGRIVYAGREIDRLGAAARARLGIARSYQIARIFPELSLTENVTLALECAAPHFRFWRSAGAARRSAERAAAVLDEVGLADRGGSLAGTLSHGDKRTLELAMILSTGPRLLLLDEPMAGLGPSEAAALVERLAGLHGGPAIILIEHDMDAVFALADRVTVLVRGRVLLTDLPAKIRSDPEVQRAYLGDAAPGASIRTTSLEAAHSGVFS